ncbi:MAG: transketolase [Clostridia bacterium]|nr:transketolase [Clostridia bacterium]
MNIETKTLNYLKAMTAETISNAKSGHTGSALGGSSILLALFDNHLNFDASGNNWPNRDRFVMSAGHASALLYNTLHLYGYDISMDDLKNFRKYDSRTPGHPEYGIVPGVETTTGPLGQGVANAVGLAIAAKKMNSINPTLFNNHTYCYAGDGCLMEGVAMEACSLAGKLCLNKLILLYDDNGITLDGEKVLSNNENMAKKFEAMGWNVILVDKGNDYHDCAKAISKAKKSTLPTIIIFKTVIGIGTVKQGTSGAHGYPLSSEELLAFKKSLGITESFYYPDDVVKHCNEAKRNNDKMIADWNKVYAKHKDEIESQLKSNPEEVVFKDIVKLLSEKPDMAGRDASNVVLNELSKSYNFFGGTADLASSTKAFLKDGGAFSKDNAKGNNIYFGIREHAMGSIVNGIALYGNFFAFDSTFVSFSNYMFPSLRMRSMMNIPALSIFTHDSINIGEDGPTHQPIEQITQLRSFVGLQTFRPATYAEVVSGYKYFVTKKAPTVLALTKSKISNPKLSTIERADRGGYVIYETGTKQQIEIYASGTEVYLAMKVADELNHMGVRVISVPNEKIFDSQTANYKAKVMLPAPVLRVAIEATNDNVWYKYIGRDGLLLNINEYQYSGNGTEVYEKAGFEVKTIASKINKKLKL